MGTDQRNCRKTAASGSATMTTPALDRAQPERATIRRVRGTAGPLETLGWRPPSLQVHSPRGPWSQEARALDSSRSSPRGGDGRSRDHGTQGHRTSAGSAPSPGFKGRICGLSLNTCPVPILCPLQAGAPRPSPADSQDVEPASPLPRPAGRMQGGTPPVGQGAGGGGKVLEQRDQRAAD